MASEQLTQLVRQVRQEREPLLKLLEQVSSGQAELRDFLALARQEAEVKLPAGRCKGVDVGGVPGEWIAAPGVQGQHSILYIHGGVWFRGSVNLYREFLYRLSAATGARVLGINYRLAPEAPFPAGLDDCTRAYHWLLGQGVQPQQLEVMGDSAGANLALATVLNVRDHQAPLPAALVCLSIVADLALTGATHVTHAQIDPVLGGSQIAAWCAKQYSGGADPLTPLASPLYADHRGLPPLLSQVGGAEVLLDDSRRLAERARAAGVDVRLEVWDDMIHDFQFYAAILPEGQQALERIGAFARRHFRAEAAA